MTQITTRAYDIVSLIKWPLVLFGEVNYKQENATTFYYDYIHPVSRRKMQDGILKIYHITTEDGVYGLTQDDEDLFLVLSHFYSQTRYVSQRLDLPNFTQVLDLWKSNNGHYFKKLEESLIRLKGIVFHCNRWVDREKGTVSDQTFSLIDNWSIKERYIKYNEIIRQAYAAKSQTKWLDLDVYLKIKDPLAKKIYRLLDYNLFCSGFKSKNSGIYEISMMYMCENYLGMGRGRMTSYYINRLKKSFAELTEKNLFACEIVTIGRVKYFKAARLQSQIYQSS